MSTLNALPIVGYLNIKACMPRTLDFAGTPGALRTEPLCKVSDARAPIAAASAVPSTWQQMAKAANPRSDAEFWPDELKVRYMSAEIDALRMAIAAAPQPPSAAMQPLTDADLKVKLDSLTDGRRRELFSNFCTSCGSTDPRCQCWIDE